jgi:hypothetical protein
MTHIAYSIPDSSYLRSSMMYVLFIYVCMSIYLMQLCTARLDCGQHWVHVPGTWLARAWELPIAIYV